MVESICWFSTCFHRLSKLMGGLSIVHHQLPQQHHHENIETTCVLPFNSQRHLPEPWQTFRGWLPISEQNFMFGCSILLLPVPYDKDRRHLFIVLSAATDEVNEVNSSSWNFLDESTGVGGMCCAHWLHISCATYNQAHSFTVIFYHIL